MTFPVTCSRGQQADLPAVATLAQAVLAELRADWGAVVPLSRAALIVYIQNGAVPCVAYDATTLRGATLFTPMHDGTWECTLVLTDKNLTAANRLSVFWQTLQWAAAQVPGQTLLFGRVKANGNLDNYLAVRVPDRTLSPDGTVAVYRVTAGGVLGVVA